MSVVSLDDKYTLENGSVFLSGTQALVRLTIQQAWRDRAARLNTAGFISGYRGSPLAGVDLAFEAAVRFTQPEGIRFLPGVNEDLAATAIMGTQQINLLERANKQGVFAFWYGKGPGVDRSGDVFRHGNLAGSAAVGGVLLMAGDDHTCKSSTTSHQSEFALMDAMVPILTPGSVNEIVTFGLYGWALSRYSGCWASLKLVSEVVDSSASIRVDSNEPHIVLPSDFEMPLGGLNVRWPDTPQEQERRLHNYKIPAVLAFARANGLDRIIFGREHGRICLITTGKGHRDTMQALEDLGITEAVASEIGLSVYKVAMVWPLEPQGIRRIAGRFGEIHVVEEKRSLIEAQIKDILYDSPATMRPSVLGKLMADGAPALPAHDNLDAGMIARTIWARIQALGGHPLVAARAAALPAPLMTKAAVIVERTPYFCSGCPHNTSTRLPAGSRSMAGIGCSWMAQAMDRNTATYTHMGGEGANWIGIAPYVPTEHVFQLMGDGTFFHSGLLALRAAVAAKVTMTYKILFNDAVAMTGGQRHDGELTPQRIAEMVRAEGVQRIAVVADNLDKYRGQPAFPEDITMHRREDLDAVQRELRGASGVSVLIYDQVCAASKRRRNKRLANPRPETRVLINEAVCEGCGDCSLKSNCLSITPVETEYGRKRQIDQFSCNTDTSCLNGFCPSFVSVTGTELTRSIGPDLGKFDSSELPQPSLLVPDTPYNVLITGVGGTGIVTIGAILAMAAHLSGLASATLDMTGMAQKGGPVTTHLRIASAPDDLFAMRIPRAAADLVIGCDLVTTIGDEATNVLLAGRTRIVLNISELITAAFIRDGNSRTPVMRIVAALREAVGQEGVDTVDASRIATDLLHDSLGTNLFMVGYAYQRGLLPVTGAAIEQAITLNGVAVSMNRTAFALGRLAAHRPVTVEALMQRAASPGSHRLAETLDEMIGRREAYLTAYQNAAYAREYRLFVDRTRVVERSVTAHEGALSEAVSRYLFKVMAYKDEYEVARLFTNSEFQDQVRRTFVPGVRMMFHLAPPLLSRIDPATGELRKRAFGPWVITVFRILAKLRGLRGTVFDPFGYTEERRTERRLIGEYRACLEHILMKLRPENMDLAVEIAQIPEAIRGYGPVKTRNLVQARTRWTELMQRWGKQGHAPETKIPEKVTQASCTGNGSA
jgi:indolepyruvate ferredoxin oxidoreductase